MHLNISRNRISIVHLSNSKYLIKKKSNCFQQSKLTLLDRDEFFILHLLFSKCSIILKLRNKYQTSRSESNLYSSSCAGSLAEELKHSL